MATAKELSHRLPDNKIVVLEGEQQVGQQQSKHNSGVIHAGIFYKPGSNKARLCVEGADLMYEYCKMQKIPHKRIGKLIVATQETEIDQLEKLLRRGTQNGVRDLELVNERVIAELEPQVKGIRALYSPNTGICDYELVTKSFEKDFLSTTQREVVKGFQVTGFTTNLHDIIEIHGRQSSMKGSEAYPSSVFSNYVICCAGLSSAHLASLAGGSKYPVIIPFRGSYRILKQEANNLVKRNIYPVPDPRYPFLGIHFTPTVQGQVTLGPSAGLSFGKAGYSKAALNERNQSVWKEKALWNFLRKNLSGSVVEAYYDTFSLAFVHRAQKLVPNLKFRETTAGWSGIRAQAMAEDGSLVDDFVFESLGPQGRMLHVRNAPSPAATSSLAIANYIVKQALGKFLQKNS
eukprot:jgi/Galph1/2859/GphlegSOOS_G1526.1